MYDRRTCANHPNDFTDLILYMTDVIVQQHKNTIYYNTILLQYSTILQYM